MAELTNHIQADIVLDKKLAENGYRGGSKHHDFIASQELTVTITLSEYRELIESNATKKKDIDQAESDRYKRSAENEELKKKNEELKAENYELKTKVDQLKEEYEIAVESIKAKEEENKRVYQELSVLRKRVSILETENEQEEPFK